MPTNEGEIVRKVWADKPTIRDIVNYIKIEPEESVLDVIRFESMKANRAKQDLDGAIKSLAMLIQGLKEKHGFKTANETIDYIESKGIKLVDKIGKK